MPKCNNCKKAFEAYSMESAALPVLNQEPLEVVKLNCPVCGSMQHMFTATPNVSQNELHMRMTQRA
jgi:hypothetical protein